MSAVLMVSSPRYPCPIARQAPPRDDGAEPAILQHNNIAGSPASKQRPDQLHGHRLVALRTLIPTSIQQPTQNRIPRPDFPDPV